MEKAFPCIAFRDQNGTRESVLNDRCLCHLHNIAVLLNEPMEDGDLPDEIAEVEVYDGPQQGLAIRNHVCHTFFGGSFVPYLTT